MSWSFSLATDIGRARLLVPDRDEASPLFTDEELAVFLSIETGVKRAAALALETAASDQALVLKVMKVGDLTTDGAKVSDALLKRAAQLRAQADREDDADGGFDIAELVVDDFSARERLAGEVLRGQ
jgi:hypothetical protein